MIANLIGHPEYLALLVSVGAIWQAVITSNRNRKHQFHTEEYFKLQQIAEQITGKLLVLQRHQEKLEIFFKLSHRAEKNGKTFLDTNNTFDTSNFEKESEFIAAYISIYFSDLMGDYDSCLSNMGKLFSRMHLLDIQIKEKKTKIDWDHEAKEFSKISGKIGIKPKGIFDKIQTKLKEYKIKNL